MLAEATREMALIRKACCQCDLGQWHFSVSQTSREHSSDREKILKAFRLIVCRKPSDKEMKIMEDYYAGQLEAYRAKKLDAARTLNIGEYPQDKHADSNTTAALAKLIGTLYNLEEAITKS